MENVGVNHIFRLNIVISLCYNALILFYWSSDSGNAEVEFVVQGDAAVFPIEAKAGINTKAKSLKVFRELFQPPYAIRTSLAPHREGPDIKDIPLYAIGSQLPRLLRCAAR